MAGGKSVKTMTDFEEVGVIIGLTADQPRQICTQTGVHLISAESSSQQIIGGTHSALEKAFDLALAEGARKAHSLDPYRNTFKVKGEDHG